jgi:hypothetical protein
MSQQTEPQINRKKNQQETKQLVLESLSSLLFEGRRLIKTSTLSLNQSISA